jgi:hypothetical protein
MTYLHRGSHLMPAVLVGLAISGLPARGASLGFQQYLKHEHPEVLALPRLHEPAPSHVPHLTNEGLIRFWANNEFSPILRNAQIQMQLCEAVTEHRDLNPARFDHYHPTLGHLIRDPRFFAYALAHYNSHQARFTYYHHHLIPFIRGCAMMMMAPKPIVPTAGPATIVPPGSTTVPPGSTTVSPVPGEISNGPGTPPPGPVSVPAPPSAVLLVLGMGYVALRRRGRQFISTGKPISIPMS